MWNDVVSTHTTCIYPVSSHDLLIFYMDTGCLAAIRHDRNGHSSDAVSCGGTMAFGLWQRLHVKACFCTTAYAFLQNVHVIVFPLSPALAVGRSV